MRFFNCLLLPAAVDRRGFAIMADPHRLAQWSAVMAALRGRESSHASDIATCEFKRSSPARFFFFERCQTTPGKPFSGTSGSPV